MEIYDFGIRLRELRTLHRWSQEELGRKINRSKATVSSFENNVKTPPTDVLIDLATVLNVSLDYLVGIDKKDMVSIEGLTDRQKSLVHTLLADLRDSGKKKKGLSLRQQDILNMVMLEFNSNQ